MEKVLCLYKYIEYVEPGLSEINLTSYKQPDEKQTLFFVCLK